LTDEDNLYVKPVSIILNDIIKKNSIELKVNAIRDKREGQYNNFELANICEKRQNGVFKFYRDARRGRW
jgi:hypothetical protein